MALHPEFTLPVTSAAYEKAPMQPSPQLAVIMTHYDCPRFLGQAVASVLGQTYSDLELHLIDDNTPGGTWLEAIRPYRDDPRLKLWISDRNVGTYRLKSAIIPHIRSQFVGFHDSDDFSLPDRFGQQLRMLERKRLDIIGSGIAMIDEAGVVRGERRFPWRCNWLERLGKTHFIHHPATTVRRAVFDRIGTFDGTARIGADTDFILRAAQRFRIGNVRALLYRYRLRPDSLTGARETGYGSVMRETYRQQVLTRWRAYRGCRDDVPLKAAPSDIDFTLAPASL
jgi:glycosyltransferase involved in cell wall biosynthesis